MISILLPLHNFDARDLLSDLRRQLDELNLENAEIIVGDDASHNDFRILNETLAKNLEIQYLYFDPAKGRSGNRNHLAKLAKNEYLIFLDADAAINSANFLKNYVEASKNHTIICGGTKYAELNDKKFALRYNYGIHREQKTAKLRNQTPKKAFSSFNFLIQKSIFKQIMFDERLKTYGHEDTLLGIELQKNNIPVHHIDNPLIHKGLDSAEVFIQKTENGIKNLLFLLEKYKNSEKLYKNIRLLQVYREISKLRLRFFFRLAFKILRKPILKNLKSNSPNIRLFDFYKLGFLLENSRNRD